MTFAMSLGFSALAWVIGNQYPVRWLALDTVLMFAVLTFLAVAFRII